MPAVNKRPVYPHKNSQWSWDQYDTFHRSNIGFKEFGVLLKQLCVIDVDDINVADDLEARFPYLKSVPTEQTIKGRHYWFFRSTLADNGCFYDGVSQVIDKVDFKSITAEGTSGFVVVAPSYGKVWHRPITRAKYAPSADLLDPVVTGGGKLLLAPIPDDLLRAVARPRTEYVPKSVHDDWNAYKEHVVLTFTDGECIKLVDIKSPYILKKMTYFDIMSLLDSHPTSELILNAPCTIVEFNTIYYFCVHKELVCTDVGNIIDVADRLGLRMDVFKKLRYAVTELFDIGCVCPAMLNALICERKGRRNSASYELLDVFNVSRDVEASEANDLLVNDNGEHVWLFDGLDVPTLRVCPNLRLIPKDVDTILSSYPGKLVLAGGSALCIAVDGVGSGSDYDMFLVDVDEAEASMILHEIETTFRKQPGCTVLLTRHAMTIVFDDNRDPIQIILRLHTCVAGVLLGFDISAARVGVGYDSIGVLRMWCTDSWLVCVKHRMFVLESVFWGRGSIARIIKYIGKGFNCMVPVGRSHMMRRLNYHDMMQYGMEYNNMMQYGRLSGLFAAERFLSLRRLRFSNAASYNRSNSVTVRNSNNIPWWWSLLGCGNGGTAETLWGNMHTPLSCDECKLIAFSVSIHSDYDMASKATRKLKYVVRGIRNTLLKLGLSLGYLHDNNYNGIKSLTRTGLTGTLNDDARVYTFVKPAAMGMFYPMDICFDEVYDID
jgi:hypothetical protein